VGPVRAVFYHGVVERSMRNHYYSSIFTDHRAFEAEMAELARHWQPMSLAEIHARLADDRALPATAVHVSLDDGFTSTLVAAEICDRHRIPWTLFVVVDAVLDGYQPWFVRVANTLGASSNVQRADGSVVDIGTADRKWRMAREVKATLMTAPASQHDDVVDSLLGRPGLHEPPDGPWQLLGLADVAELHRAGVEIGNHSARHVNLTRADETQLQVEIGTSRDRLADALGAPVRFLSYPDGRFNPRVERVAAADHDLAMSTWRPGARTRRFAIPRRAGGLGRLERTLAPQVDPRGWTDWVRWQGPVRVQELRARVARRTG
jgi:peptidoglycan/xylan/chitin deacetylase (PgdA/CDA1 family)